MGGCSDLRARLLMIQITAWIGRSCVELQRGKGKIFEMCHWRSNPTVATQLHESTTGFQRGDFGIRLLQGRHANAELQCFDLKRRNWFPIDDLRGLYCLSQMGQKIAAGDWCGTERGKMGSFLLAIDHDDALLL